MRRYNFGMNVVIISVLVLILTGCTKEKVDHVMDEKTNYQAPVRELNFIGHWMNEGQREHLIRDFAREYEFLNQDVLINLRFPEEIGYNRYETNSTMSFINNLFKQDKPQWDVMVLTLSNDIIGDYLGEPKWAEKYLVDFSQYPEFTKNMIKGIDIKEQKKEWGGIIPGPFLEGYYWALWTNVKVAEKIGIKVKQFGMTADDFISYLKAVHIYNKNNSERIIALKEASDFKTAFNIAIHLYASIIKDEKVIYEDEASEEKLYAWEKTLEILEQFAEFEPINKDWSAISWNDTKYDLLNEKCLFFTNGSWMYNIWQESNPDKVKNCIPTEYPVLSLPAKIYPYGYGNTWGVLKNSPNKDEAIDFLMALNKPSMAEQWGRTTKCPTGIRGNFTGGSFGTDPFERFAAHVQSNYGLNRYKMDENSSFMLGKNNIHLPNYFMAVFTGELTAKEAMVKIRKSLTSKL